MSTTFIPGQTGPEGGFGDAAERRRTDRRRGPTPALSRYALWGGRRAGERREGPTPHLYVDRYEPWLAGVLVAIGSLCALDAIFTLVYIQNGGAEANPLMARVIEWGPQPFVWLKCGVTNLGLVVLCLHKNFRWVKAVVLSLLGVYTALLGYHLLLAARYL